MKAELQKTAVVLFERENAWTTEQIIRIHGDYFVRQINGGKDGVWDAKDFKQSCIAVDATEARRLALEWEFEPDVVAQLAIGKSVRCPEHSSDISAECRKMRCDECQLVTCRHFCHVPDTKDAIVNNNATQ